MLRFIHASGEWDEENSRYLPLALYNSLICSLLEQVVDLKAACKKLYAECAVIQGEQAFLVRAVPERCMIELTVRDDSASAGGTVAGAAGGGAEVGGAAATSVVGAEVSSAAVVLQRLSSLLEEMQPRYGVQCRVELPCPDCAAEDEGGVLVDSGRCFSCGGRQQALCALWEAPQAWSVAPESTRNLLAVGRASTGGTTQASNSDVSDLGDPLNRQLSVGGGGATAVARGVNCPAGRSGFHIFLSHRRANRTIMLAVKGNNYVSATCHAHSAPQTDVRTICKGELEKQGYTVFIDTAKHGLGAGNFQEQLETNLRDAPVIVLLCCGEPLAPWLEGPNAGYKEDGVTFKFEPVNGWPMGIPRYNTDLHNCVACHVSYAVSTALLRLTSY